MAKVGGAPEPRGERIKIDGRTMHVVRAGPKGGELTVLLEAGSFGFSADWAVVQDQLAARGIASIAYDRAGLALSDPGPSPRDGLAIVSDLEKLLAALGEAGPFVIAGHSMAGLHIHLFAARNPDKVAGLVFVDAVTPALAADPWVRRGSAHYVRFSRAAAWAASKGLLKPLSRWGDQIGLTPMAARHKRWAFADAAHNRTAAEEVIQWETTVSQAAAAGPLHPDWPVAVVLAGPARAPARQLAVQTEPATRSPHGYQDRVAKARHASLVGARYGDAVVRAIVHVRDAAMAVAA
jgi:pimeloyl-ACP methyl ester carboxylesterase